MFILTRISDSVRIVPADFRKRLSDAVTDELNKKYANKVVPRVGLCISLYDIQNIGDPLVVPTDGCTHIHVTFRMIVFRPFISEILVGKIKSCTPQGVHVTLGFFDDILIPPHALHPDSSFVQEEQVWVWNFNGHQLFMDVDEPIRLRVKEEHFFEQFSKVLGPSASTDDKADAANRQAPYSIIGAINQDGLGLEAWWADQS